MFVRACRGIAATAACSIPLLADVKTRSSLPEEKHWIHVDLARYNLDQHHLIHSSLLGDGKVEDYRLFLAPDRASLKAELKLGHRVCGHPTIIHGGALAAVFDDCFGALFFAARVGNGFTANLNVDYRRPVPAGTNLTLEATIDRVETGHSGSKKVYLKGELFATTAEGSRVLYTEATALFVVKVVPSSESLHSSIANDSASPQ